MDAQAPAGALIVELNGYDVTAVVTRVENRLELPTRSLDLAPGQHTLRLLAADASGDINTLIEHVLEVQVNARSSRGRANLLLARLAAAHRAATPHLSAVVASHGPVSSRPSCPVAAGFRRRPRDMLSARSYKRVRPGRVRESQQAPVANSPALVVPGCLHQSQIGTMVADVRVIAASTLKDLWRDKPQFRDAEGPTLAWYRDVVRADWARPSDVKRRFGTASILKDGRAVFNIAGNKCRIVAWINHPYRLVFIRFIGTHEQCDAIDAQTI